MFFLKNHDYSSFDANPDPPDTEDDRQTPAVLPHGVLQHGVHHPRLPGISLRAREASDNPQVNYSASEREAFVLVFWHQNEEK